MRDLFDDITKVPKARKETVAVELVDCGVEYRRAYGVQQLMKVMGTEAPRKGCTYHIFTGGNVDMVSHVRWIMHVYGKIDSLTISAWNISKPDIMLLKRWMDRGEIGQIYLMVGDRFPAKHPTDWERLQEWKAVCKRFDVAADNINARFLAACTTGGDSLVLTSSAACTTNPMVELATFTESIELYGFYMAQVQDWKRLRTDRKVRNEIDSLEVFNDIDDI